MKYRIFDSVEATDTVSQAETIARDCNGVTPHWWQMPVHPGGRAALALEDGDTIEGKTLSASAMIEDVWAIAGSGENS